jgi:hypothetical protein
MSALPGNTSNAGGARWRTKRARDKRVGARGHIRYHPVMPADIRGRRLEVLGDGLHQLGARCETLGVELSTTAAPCFEAAPHESRAAL